MQYTIVQFDGTLCLYSSTEIEEYLAQHDCTWEELRLELYALYTEEHSE